jgi:membrane-associated phospholipid phosphatase
VFHWTWLIAASLAAQSTSAPAVPPPQAWPDDRPIVRLFQNLGDDVRRLPAPDAALVLGGGAAASLASHPADDNLERWARTAGGTSYTAPGRVLGEGWLQVGGAVGVYAAGRLSRHAELTHVGSDLIRAQVLNGVVTTTLKLAAGRRRPGGGARLSFPSGHTSAAFASAAVLDGHYGWKIAVPAYAAAGFIGWTRLRDRAHWMSDVVFGAAVGTVMGRTVTRGHGRRGWTLVPAAADGGVAVYVIR